VTLPTGFLGVLIAHRGLWRTGGAPENSLAAFEAARMAGYGVELDVRLSADGEAIVFHDETLDRMTRESGVMEERTAEDLTGLRLLGSDQTIPTLEAALAVIDNAPVLVELKTPPGQEGLLERRVAGLLVAHRGPIALLSFNPLALAWMAEYAPTLPRGLNAKSVDDLAGARIARADFLSVSLELAAHPDVQDWCRAGHAIAWTSRSAADQARLAGLVDVLIFEGYRP
jgi:glycerophosphoryl diester phosphodiesterase